MINMAIDLTVKEAVWQDTIEAIDWYNAKQPGLGRAVLQRIINGA
jgi:hypothetical protein